jgi:hypothetical protein
MATNMMENFRFYDSYKSLSEVLRARGVTLSIKSRKGGKSPSPQSVLEAAEAALQSLYQLGHDHTVVRLGKNGEVTPVFPEPWIEFQIPWLEQEIERLSDFWQSLVGWAHEGHKEQFFRFTVPELLDAKARGSVDELFMRMSQLRSEITSSQRVLKKRLEKKAAMLNCPKWMRVTLDAKNRVVDQEREYPGWLAVFIENYFS